MCLDPFMVLLPPQGGPNCGLGPGAQQVLKKGDEGPFNVEALDEIRMRHRVKMEKQVSAGWFRWCGKARGLRSSRRLWGQTPEGFGEAVLLRAMAQSIHYPGDLRRAQVSPAASAKLLSLSVRKSSCLRACYLQPPLVPNDQSSV